MKTEHFNKYITLSPVYPISMSHDMHIIEGSNISFPANIGFALKKKKISFKLLYFGKYENLQRPFGEYS